MSIAESDESCKTNPFYAGKDTTSCSYECAINHDHYRPCQIKKTLQKLQHVLKDLSVCIYLRLYLTLCVFHVDERKSKINSNFYTQFLFFFVVLFVFDFSH